MKPDGKILPICMTIAGSDSGGGAGIQADLKTFASLKCYGVSVVTSVTAQNTKGVDDIHIVPNQVVKNQIKSIKKDMKFSAVKTGMIPEKMMVETIVSCLSSEKKLNLVVDPVIVATSGDKLVSEESIEVARVEVSTFTPLEIHQSLIIFPAVLFIMRGTMRSSASMTVKFTPRTSNDSRMIHPIKPAPINTTSEPDADSSIMQRASSRVQQW